MEASGTPERLSSWDPNRMAASHPHEQPLEGELMRELLRAARASHLVPGSSRGLAIDPFRESKGAILMLSQILVDDPQTGIGAWADHVYEMDDGCLAVVDNDPAADHADLARRNVELSVVRAVLVNCYARRVQRTGYVRKHQPGAVPVFEEIQLLDERCVYEAYRRNMLAGREGRC
jgi:hypothetical protein